MMRYSSMRSLLSAFLLSAVALTAQIPRPSPELVISLPNGQQELLTKHKGKVVVLEFMFTTCPHCQNTARILSKLQNELGPKGFRPLGVAINPDPDVPGFIKKYNVNFVVGTGTRDAAYAYLQKSVMSSFTVPQIVIVDKKGMIRYQYTGNDAFISTNEEANLRETISKLLAEGGTSADAKPSAAKMKKKAS